MRTDDFRAQCLAPMNHLLTPGFLRPISFAAIASDGLTTLRSSETVTGPPAEVAVKTATSHGPLSLYPPPIHVLFIDPQGAAAYPDRSCGGHVAPDVALRPVILTAAC